MKLNYTGLYVSLLMSCAANGTPTLSELSPDTEAVMKRAAPTIMEGKENISHPSNLPSSPTSKRKHHQKAEQDSGKGNGKRHKDQSSSSAGRRIEATDEQGQGQLSTQQSCQAAEQMEVEIATRPEIDLYALDQMSMYMWSFHKETPDMANLERQLAHVLYSSATNAYAADQAALYINSLQETVFSRKGLNAPEQKLVEMAKRLQDIPYALDQASLYMNRLNQESENIKAGEAKRKVQEAKRKAQETERKVQEAKRKGQKAPPEAKLAYVLQSIGTDAAAFDQATPYIESLCRQLNALKIPSQAESDNQMLPQTSPWKSPRGKEKALFNSTSAAGEEGKVDTIHGKRPSHFGSLQGTPNWQAQKMPSRRGRSLSRSTSNTSNIRHGSSSSVPKLPLQRPGQDFNVPAPSMGLRTKSSPTLPVAVPVAVPELQTAAKRNKLRNSSEAMSGKLSISLIPSFSRSRVSPRHNPVDEILGTADTHGVTDLPPSSPRGKSPRSPRMAP